ncbi:MotA/TolQ/ExbB proton channel family protein [Treponema sp.]|uniref:MotA/TolQ/ExbB proton channel family protein n=1 Tax=Treponema sp. TaxID=166 RepID=UPI00388F8847
MNLLEMFNLGGPFMWILLMFSIATFALIIERCVYLFWHDCKVDGLAKEIKNFLKDNRKRDAENMLKQCTRKKTAATVFLALLENSAFGENRMERAAEGEAQERIRRMESGFNYLTALASLAPLTGFLGTVSGMIGAFKSIASATDVNAQLVAGGIYEALITTVFGLIIAIIASIGYNLLVQRVDNFAAEISKAVNDLVPILLKEREND